VAASAWRHPRSRRTLSLFASIVAATGLMLGFATAAHATPSATDLENQIDKEWASLEPTIENYDAVHQKLTEQQQKAAKLQKQIAPLALQVEVKMARVGSIAAGVYEAGPSGTLTTLLNADSSADALNVLGTLDQMAADQRAEVSGAMKLEAKYETQKKPIDALVASLKTQQTSLAKQKVDIQKKINSLNAQRLAAFGSTRASGSLRPVACPQVYTGDKGSQAARFACSQIGKPYVWDTDGPNTYDCSGLTLASWRSVGVTLPHNAYQQKHMMPAVSKSELKPGDLVFYYPNIAHVTIYVGNGWVVSAPETGDVVRMKRYDDITPVGYGRPHS
jgi:peptidoglycan DL-endopeptidase CwlO